MPNTPDLIPDYESAWNRLNKELSEGTLTLDAIPKRMDQIEAFVTVTAMLKLREHST